MANITVALVGNPNCGKTSVFNALTGLHQKVGNWAGVTVERKEGFFPTAQNQIRLVDLPGLYSVSLGRTPSDDESIARDYILSREAQVVINVVDGSNIDRHLYLTSQLINMKIPMILVVNMLDVAEQEGIQLDLETLSEQLGCPVVGMIASEEKGVSRLHNSLDHLLEDQSLPVESIEYPLEVKSALGLVQGYMNDHEVVDAHWHAISFLESGEIPEKLESHEDDLKSLIAPLETHSKEGLDLVVADARYRWVAQVAEKTITRKTLLSSSLTDKIDRIVLNRWLGLPIFLGIMYVMFLFTQNLGGSFIDLFDIVVGGFFVDGSRIIFESMGMPEWLIVMLSDGIGGGIQTVATFIPVVFFLFLFLAFLEDSGYMARAAFVLDRIMRSLGLPGKAFVPLICGFGCTVPAILGTRTMDRTSDRLTTIMMAPFMSCGARLPVYVLFAAAFFPTNGQNLVFLLYILGIVAAILTGLLLKKSLFTGESSAVVMELPLYHIPRPKNIWIRTQERVMQFVKNAGKIVVIIVACLSFLNSIGTDNTFGNQDSENSVLSTMGKSIVPILEPIGVQEENWPAAVGIFTGIFAKEAVVGTVNALYGGMAQAQNKANAAEAEPVSEEESSWSAMAIISEGVSTVVDNLAGLGEALGDPMGLAVDDLSDKEAAAESQEVDVSTIDMLVQGFDGTAGAFAYLLLVLFYMPCCAAIAAVYRESGALWTTLVAVWTTGFGYCSATIFYQACTFAVNPIMSTLAIVLCVAFFVGFFLFLKLYVKKALAKHPRIIPIVSKRCECKCDCCK